MSAHGPSLAAVGVDLVHVPAFAEQLGRPGSAFARGVFTAGELRVAAARARAGAGGRHDAGISDAWVRHLAGRWAVKECVVKAWSQALYGTPPPIHRDQLEWREIEIVPDAWGRIAVVLHGRVMEAFTATVATGHPGAHLAASLSHDGDYATATVILAG